MPIVLPRRTWVPPKQNDPNQYHLISFDPGGTIGWARFCLSSSAFSRPENKVLANLISWDCGEFEGTETEQIQSAVTLIHSTRGHPFRNRRHVIGEDFDFVHTIGGKTLLSPVRINAVIDWECRKDAIDYTLQNRSMRTAVTPHVLTTMGFVSTRKRWTKTGKGKDEFAAMQHGVTWLRRLKALTRGRPWKLSDGVTTNAYWDCACSYEQPLKGGYMGCDLVHP